MDGSQALEKFIQCMAMKWNEVAVKNLIIMVILGGHLKLIRRVNLNNEKCEG